MSSPQNLSDYNTLVSYVKALASEHVDVAHDDDNNPAFHVIDDQYLQNASYGGADVLILLEYDEGQLQTSQSDNNIDRLTVAINAMRVVHDDMDDQAIASTRRVMKKILLEFWSRMQRDQRERTIEHIDRESLSYQFIGPALGQRYGCRIQFELMDVISLQYDPAKWA